MHIISTFAVPFIRKLLYNPRRLISFASRRNETLCGSNGRCYGAVKESPRVIQSYFSSGNSGGSSGIKGGNGSANQQENPSIITFEQMMSIVKLLETQGSSETSSQPEYRIIDVREPEEVKNTGKIHDALNIPVAEVPKALRTSPADFVKMYGLEKFKDNQTLVFYCQSGKRSQVAADYANQNGFKAVNYAGSFKDWSSRIGKE